jgi:EmrB/QacA subfamily drug resistance transporter
MSRPYKVLAVCGVATFLVSMDVSVLNVAFRAIIEDFGADKRTLLTWTFSGYNVAYAAGLLTAGRRSGRLGRKRIFLTGTGVFVVGSALCALSTSAEMLVAARVVQAIGGALLTPASLSLVLPEFPLEKRSVAIGVWGAIGGIAAATGPTIGGIIVDTISWHWVFAINVPLGIIAMTLAARQLRETPKQDTGAPDVIGALLSMGGVGLIVLAIVESDRWGAGSGRTIGVAAAGVALLAVFVGWCRRNPDAVFDVTLARLRFFTAGNLASLLFSVGFYAMFFVGYSAVRAGLAISPGPFMAAVFAFPAGKWAERYGHRAVVTAGCVVFCIGVALNLAFLDASPGYLFPYLPAMMITGIGVGLTIAMLGASSNAFLPPHRFAMGSAVNTTLRQVGAAIGIALAAALLAGGSPGSLRGFRVSWALIIVSVLTAAVAMAALYQRPTDAQRAAAAGPSARSSPRSKGNPT